MLSLRPLLRRQALALARPTIGGRSFGEHMDAKRKSQDDRWHVDRLNTSIGHNFPDFIEHWNRDLFRQVGYGMNAAVVLSAVGPAVWTSLTAHPVSYIPSAILAALTAGYWRVGKKDMEQSQHAVRRNYPVLGNMRYIMETIRPEMRQYIVESDSEGRPYSRLHRSQVYQRGECLKRQERIMACRAKTASHFLALR